MAQVEKISSEPNSKMTKNDSSLILTDTKELEIRFKFGEETHLYIRDCIKQVDQKAVFFLL